MSNTPPALSLSLFQPEDDANILYDGFAFSPKPQKRVLRRRGIAFNKEAMEELENEREITRQIAKLAETSPSYNPDVLIYSNGLLLNQDGEIVLMRDYNITQTDIDAQLSTQTRYCDMEADECFITAQSKPHSTFPPQPKLMRGQNVLFDPHRNITPNVAPVDLWEAFEMESAPMTPMSASIHNTIFNFDEDTIA